jgi:hypothetical protein
MNDADIDAIVRDILKWEWDGKTENAIRDTTEQGWFTVGAGWKASDEIEACRFPFYNRTSGREANHDEVIFEYRRVMNLPAGRVAGYYANRGAPQIVVPKERVFMETRRKLVEEVLPKIPGVFPGFEGYPLAARRGIVDIAWNTGVGAPAAAGHRATGLHAFGDLISACEAGNWGARLATLSGVTYAPGTAAAEAHRREPPERHERNVWCQDLFASCSAA